MSIEEAIRHQVGAALTKIENEAGLKILFAVESGSRAWGFPSPDSDYDVRFVFVRPYTAYLSITEKKESLVFPVTNELDLDGWDIKKVLRQISKSNPVMYEWLQSPIIYKEEPGLIESLWQLVLPYFSPYAGLYHYLGLVKNFYTQLQADQTIKIKKLFYILRPLLAAWWIKEKKSTPPMEFRKLLTLCSHKRKLIAVIEVLLKEKAKAGEGTVVTVPSLLLDFIVQIKQACENDTSFVPQRREEISPLDRYFLKLLKESMA